MINKLEKAKVIWLYVPLFGSNRVSALPRIFSCKRNSGLYNVGHGERPVIWYWRFDMEKQCLHKNYWLCGGSRILYGKQINDLGGRGPERGCWQEWPKAIEWWQYRCRGFVWQWDFGVWHVHITLPAPSSIDINFGISIFRRSASIGLRFWLRNRASFGLTCPHAKCLSIIWIDLLLVLTSCGLCMTKVKWFVQISSC